MIITDAFVDGILRDMGVDVDKKKPPHWITKYYQSKSIFEGKYENGYMCSRCGKHSWSKKKVCDGCNSVMEDIKEDDALHITRCKDCKHYTDGFCFNSQWFNDDVSITVKETDFCSYGSPK